MASLAMTDFMRRPCSSTKFSCRTFSATGQDNVASLAESGSGDPVLAARRLQLGDSKQLQNEARFALGGPAALAAAAGFWARAGRPPGSLCGAGNRNNRVGHISLLLSQIGVLRNRAAGEYRHCTEP